MEVNVRDITGFKLIIGEQVYKADYPKSQEPIIDDRIYAHADEAIQLLAGLSSAINKAASCSHHGPKFLITLSSESQMEGGEKG